MNCFGEHLATESMEKENFFCPICKGLSEDVISEILAIAHIKTFNNQKIYRQNDPYAGIYVVSKGQVRLTCYNDEGNDILVKLILENNSFGESSVSGSKYLETAFSAGLSLCVFIPGEQLARLMSRHNELSLAVLSSMGRWLVDYHNRFKSLSLHSVRKRLEYYLTHEAQKANTSQVRFDLRKHEVASNLGIRPETLSRALKELEDEGLIVRHDKMIDIKALNLSLKSSS